MQAISNRMSVCREWGTRYGNYWKHSYPRAGGTDRGHIVTRASGLRGAAHASRSDLQMGTTVIAV